MSQGTQYRGEVKRIALAGGIGAGKSTVVDYLRSKDLVAVDADEVYRDLVGCGQPLLAILVDAFGAAILTPEGELDRAFLGSVIFSDASARERLDAITHPPVGLEIRRQLDAATGEAVIAAIPLYRREHRDALAIDEVWSVQVAPEIAIDRLVNQRGITESAARSRIASQMSNEQRERLADEVIWNNTDRESLRERVDELLVESGIHGH
jgi:dephospho-CoA kinase